MLQNKEIVQTIQMIKEQNLDIRTITMHLSLLDCISDDKKKTVQNVYSKIVAKGSKLCEVANEISRKYGIPIVNKRISVTPISLIGASSNSFVEIAVAMDKAANEIGVDFIGGYSALVQKGITEYEKKFINSIPKALAKTSKVCASVNVASTKAGINMTVVEMMGRIIKETAELTKDENSIGCAKLVIFANAVEDNPFMAGSFNGVSEGDCVINVGISGPGTIKAALKDNESVSFDEISEIIRKTAFKITRMGELVGRETAQKLKAEFGIVDLSLAPTANENDSVAEVLESMGISTVGFHGTTAALAMLNDAIKKGGMMASSHVGGLSGAFIPVSEDLGMIKAVKSGVLTIDKLEAMTSVCSVGLDMIAISGDTSASTISALIADEAAIGMINGKTTAVRVIPVYGNKKEVNFGGLLGFAPVIDLKVGNADIFVNRKGRIPAPLHSYKN